MSMGQLIAPFVNLTILIGVLAYYLRRPIQQAVLHRHETLRNDIASVRDLLLRAQEQYNEFTGKLKAIDAELVALRDQVRQDAQATKRQIGAEAQKISAHMVSDAQVAATLLYGEMKRDLYVELTQNVLDRTEALLRDRLTGDDRVRIRNEFSRQVGNVQ